MNNTILNFILNALSLAIVIFASIWIYRDAKKRRMWALLWAYMALFLPVIGWGIYLFIRLPLYDKPCPGCEDRLEKGDPVCNECPYNFKLIAEEKGLIPSYKKASISKKIKSFFLGLKYLLKISKVSEKSNEEEK